MVKGPSNPAGTPLEAFDQIRTGVFAGRSPFFKELTTPFHGYNREGAKVPEGVREAFWLRGVMAPCFRIKTFSKTDITEDLKGIDVTTLILMATAIGS